MPKKPDAPDLVPCDGCATEMEPIDGGYCDACAERRADDPVISIMGRNLPLSELKMQAKDDEHLANALKGDSIQDQIKAAKAKR